MLQVNIYCHQTAYGEPCSGFLYPALANVLLISVFDLEETLLVIQDSR